MKTNKSIRVPALVFLSCLLAVVMTISAIEMFLSSYIKVTTTNSTFSTFITYGERTKSEFEESELFTTVLKDSVNEVTRMCVIRDQMEKKGKYDGSKPVDISAYANRTSVVEYQGCTAEYKLEDLVKWGNYGFDFEVITGSKAELDSYFAAMAAGESMPSNPDRIVHIDEYYANEEISGMIMSNISESQEEMLDDEAGYYSMYVLLDKYSSVEGKKLATYASNRKEYATLIENLCSSASDLFVNYTEYNEYNKRFEDGATNLAYCYQMSDGKGNIRRHSNIAADIDSMTNEEISKLFIDYSKYICFNPDKLQMASNVENVESVFMKECIDSYKYAFGDGSRIWLAVDCSFPVEDEFKMVKDIYSQKNDSFVPSTITFFVSLFAIIATIVLMTLWTGTGISTDETGNKKKVTAPCKIDRIPFEIYLFISAVLIIGTYAVILVSAKLMVEGGYDTIVSNSVLIKAILATEVAVFTLISCVLYLIFVRKIKCKLVWKGSILQWITSKTKSGVIDAYDNGQVIIRTWLPYLIFLCVNLILVLLGKFFILAAFILDIAIGVWLYNEAKQRNKIADGIRTIAGGDTNYKVDVTSMHGDNLTLANAVNSIGDGISRAIEISMKDEKMKADLITNVSHDIKTPLTSIINYVDLLKRENIKDAKIRNYIAVLDQKSQRLKALTNDLVEASKISSGNISLNIEKINLVELVNQSVGEFSEKFEEKGLRIMVSKPDEPVNIMADSRGIYRVIENLYNNVYKYSLENTRVYVDITGENGLATLSVKNISADALNVSADELVERFTRGDASRRTEGSGLGLSIAKSLVTAMNGTFDISLDGDLFKVVITFKSC